MSKNEAGDGSPRLARFAGRARALSWDPFILPQGFAPGRRRLATRMATREHGLRPGLVDELREGPGGAGTQTWAHSGTMGL